MQFLTAFQSRCSLGTGYCAPALRGRDDDDEDESNREVKDREKRPEKPAKRRLSEPKPICTINPNVKKVSPKAKKAKSTSASKEK